VILIRWRVKTDQRGSLLIQREILAGPENIEDYFSEKDIFFREITATVKMAESEKIPLL
jgi:hypothetical protein